MRKLRLLWASNAPWAKSGYGVQSMHLLKRFRELPFIDEVAIQAWWGLQGAVLNVDGIQVYPKVIDSYGRDVIPALCRDVFKADLLVTLVDIWVYRNQKFGDQIPGTAWCPWFPIDHDPVSWDMPEWLETVHTPLQYSTWAQKALKEQQGIDSVYLPHGISDVFRPVSHEEKMYMRQESGIPPETFLISIVAANLGYPDRKAFQVQFRSFSSFLARHPEAMLYVHADPTDAQRGLNLRRLAAMCSIPEDRIRFPRRIDNLMGTIDEDNMAAIYQVSDLVSLASMAEGFGIPNIEAGGCGIPVVNTDFSSMPEVTMWGVSTKPMDYIYWPMVESFQAWPDWFEIYTAYELFYRVLHETPESDLANKRQEVSFRTHEKYNWNVVVDKYWAPFLQTMAEGALPTPARDFQQMRWAGDDGSEGEPEPVPAGVEFVGDEPDPMAEEKDKLSGYPFAKNEEYLDRQDPGFVDDAVHYMLSSGIGVGL